MVPPNLWHGFAAGQRRPGGGIHKGAAVVSSMGRLVASVTSLLWSVAPTPPAV